MVVGFYVGDVFVYFLDDVCVFVVEYGRKQFFWVFFGKGVGVGVINVGGDDLYQYFIGFWVGYVDFFNYQGFVCFLGDGGF